MLVALVADPGPLRLVLTRRADSLPTHKGQVAFPGGHVDPGEKSSERTALREAWEEIRLPPASVEVLGLLNDVPTREGTVAVTPVVGLVSELPGLVPSRDEVARIFTIPVEDLLHRERWEERRMEAGGRIHRVYFFGHEGEMLWGLSARIVLDLLSATPAWGRLDGLV